VDGGFVPDGELVVAGGDGAVALEPVNAAFDGVALLVQFLVEGRRTASGPAFVLPVADPVGLLRDRAPDPAAPQVVTVGAGIVGLVGQYPVRAGAGPAGAAPGHLDAAQHDLELRAVAALPGGDHDGQGFLALLAGQVDLGGQPAAGPAQPVIVRLVLDAAGRLGLQVPLIRAPAAC